ANATTSSEEASESAAEKAREANTQTPNVGSTTPERGQPRPVLLQDPDDLFFRVPPVPRRPSHLRRTDPDSKPRAFQGVQVGGRKESQFKGQLRTLYL